MRNIVNISLPSPMAQVLEKNIKKGHFSSKSEFFRMLFRLWMERELKDELDESREELSQGKGKLLRSLRDLR